MKHQFGPAIAEAETAIAEDPNYADAYAAEGFFQHFSATAEEGLCERRKGLRLSPRDPGVPFAILYVPSSFSSRPMGTGDRMVQQVNRWRSYEFLPLVDLAAANAWARSRQRSKGGRGPIAESLPWLHRANLGGPFTLATIRPSTRNFSASSRACARPGSRRAKRRRIKPAPEPLGSCLPRPKARQKRSFALEHEPPSCWAETSASGRTDAFA